MYPIPHKLYPFILLHSSDCIEQRVPCFAYDWPQLNVKHLQYECDVSLRGFAAKLCVYKFDRSFYVFIHVWTAKNAWLISPNTRISRKHPQKKTPTTAKMTIEGLVNDFAAQFINNSCGLAVFWNIHINSRAVTSVHAYRKPSMILTMDDWCNVCSNSGRFKDVGIE